jgi:hypothetical protein
MTFINTDGLSFLGPGSEWFWTAFQGIVLALSLWGILRQVRIQTAQKLRQDVADFDAQWQSERMLRHRLVIATAQRDGTMEDLWGSAPNTVANFWEMVGSLTRAKHLDKTLMAQLVGESLCDSWQALDSYVQRGRRMYSTDVYRDFEWLVHETVRLDPDFASFLSPRPQSGRASTVEALEGLIDVEVALRH